MGGRLRLEAYTLTFIDGFHLLAWSCVVALLLVAAVRRSHLNYGDLGTLQQQPSERFPAKPIAVGSTASVVDEIFHLSACTELADRGFGRGAG